MEENLQQLLKQADDLRDGIQKIHDQSKTMGYNAVGIRECAETIQRCLKKWAIIRLPRLPPVTNARFMRRWKKL